MSDEVKVVLVLSEEAQLLLEQQGVNIYQELQHEIPSLRLINEADPTAAKGSRDIVPVLYGVAAVITSLTPVILAILKQITPPNSSKTWSVEDITTHHPDGTVTHQRKQIRSSDEQRPWTSLPSEETSPSEKKRLPENTREPQP